MLTIRSILDYILFYLGLFCIYLMRYPGVGTHKNMRLIYVSIHLMHIAWRSIYTIILVHQRFDSIKSGVEFSTCHVNSQKVLDLGFWIRDACIFILPSHIHLLRLHLLWLYSSYMLCTLLRFYRKQVWLRWGPWFYLFIYFWKPLPIGKIRYKTSQNIIQDLMRTIKR
jgi:hypothetical protein